MESVEKDEKYGRLIGRLELLLSSQDEQVSVLANAAAAIREAFGFFWVGFYVVKGGELILGPFQGGPACTRIGKGRGVCGTAWAESRGIVVPDVEKFPGHIACSSLSRSEIVVPIYNEAGDVFGVLDIDSDRPDTFDSTDLARLEFIARIISRNLQPSPFFGE